MRRPDEFSSTKVLSVVTIKGLVTLVRASLFFSEADDVVAHIQFRSEHGPLVTSSQGQNLTALWNTRWFLQICVFVCLQHTFLGLSRLILRLRFLTHWFETGSRPNCTGAVGDVQL